MHNNPNIALLYSGSYQCASGSYYGCPKREDADFIDHELTHIDMLFTHIPPPSANIVEFVGIKADEMCGDDYTCSWKYEEGVLPSIKTSIHLYGHDHNNLYVGISFLLN